MANLHCYATMKFDDKVFYEVALSVDNTYLTTGNNKHFPKSPFVVTPTKLLEIFNSKELS